MTSSVTRPHGVLSNAGWSAFGTLFNIVIAFLLAPLLINRLGVDQWGLLLLVWSVAGILGLANFGMGEATLRYIAHFHADRDLDGVNRVLGASLTFYVVVCLFMSAVVWAASGVVVDWVKVPEDTAYAAEPLLRLTTVLFAAGMLTNAYRAIPMALHRYDIAAAIGSIQGIVRSAGLVILVLASFSVVQLVVWEALVAVAGLVVHVAVARRLVAGLRWLPSMSLAGIREIFRYSVFSFMTHVFLMVYRESGRLLLGNRLGMASVAYLGTPDSVSYRLHMIVVSAVETLVPRFSASRDADKAKALLSASTWVAFACAAALYVPLAVLMPDFLRLWIGAEFAREAGEVGTLLTLGLIGAVTFAPIATLFRGRDRPGFVTAVMAAAGMVVLLGSLLLIPVLGVAGVGYAHLLANLAWLVGLVVGWIRLYGSGSLIELARVAGLPLVLACCLGYAEVAVRESWGEMGWIGLFGLGAAFAAVGAAVIVGLDLALGRGSPARVVLDRILGASRVVEWRARIGFGRPS
jgi:O-antigen/teichoic acid export membrane protein